MNVIIWLNVAPTQEEENRSFVEMKQWVLTLHVPLCYLIAWCFLCSSPPRDCWKLQLSFCPLISWHLGNEVSFSLLIFCCFLGFKRFLIVLLPRYFPRHIDSDLTLLTQTFCSGYHRCAFYMPSMGISHQSDIDIVVSGPEEVLYKIFLKDLLSINHV